MEHVVNCIIQFSEILEFLDLSEKVGEKDRHEYVQAIYLIDQLDYCWLSKGGISAPWNWNEWIEAVLESVFISHIKWSVFH